MNQVDEYKTTREQSNELIRIFRAAGLNNLRSRGRRDFTVTNGAAWFRYRVMDRLWCEGRLLSVLEQIVRSGVTLHMISNTHEDGRITFSVWGTVPARRDQEQFGEIYLSDYPRGLSMQRVETEEFVSHYFDGFDQDEIVENFNLAYHAHQFQLEGEYEWPTTIVLPASQLKRGMATYMRVYDEFKTVIVTSAREVDGGANVEVIGLEKGVGYPRKAVFHRTTVFTVRTDNNYQPIDYTVPDVSISKIECDYLSRYLIIDNVPGVEEVQISSLFNSKRGDFFWKITEGSDSLRGVTCVGYFDTYMQAFDGALESLRQIMKEGN